MVINEFGQLPTIKGWYLQMLIAVQFLILCGIFIYLLIITAENKNFLDNLFYYLTACGFSDFSKRLIYCAGNVDVPPLYYTCLMFPDILFAFILIINRNRISIKHTVFVSCLLGVLCIQGAIFAGVAAVLMALKSYAILTIWFILDEDYFIPKPIEMKKFIIKLSALLAVCGAYGIIQFQMGYFFWELNWFKYSPTGMVLREVTNFGKTFRAFSVFSGVQEYSIILVYGISLIAFLAKSKLRISLLLIFGIYLITTGSKTTLLALIAAAVFYNTKLYRSAVLLLAVFGSGIGYLYTREPSEIFELVQLVRNNLPIKIASIIDPITILPRIAILSDFFKLDQSWITVIVGHGFGASRGNIIFDNSYLMIFYELGAIGEFALFAVIIKFIKSATSIIDNSNNELNIAIAKANIVFIVTSMTAQFFSQLIGIRSFYILFSSCIWWTIISEKQIFTPSRFTTKTQESLL